MSYSSDPDQDESTLRDSDGRAKKHCPKCGEEILAVAIRCRYCKSTISDLTGRPSEGEFLAWRQGKLLVMDKESRLPDRCVKSNEPADGFTLKRRLSWHPPFVFLLILGGLLLYVLVAVCVQKTATIYIGLSHEWQARRKRRILIAWLAAIGGFAVMFAGIAVAGNAKGNDLAPFIIIGGILTFIVSLVAGILGTRLVVPTRITKTHVWLKGVHPDYLAMLPEWPGEGE